MHIPKIAAGAQDMWDLYSPMDEPLIDVVAEVFSLPPLARPEAFVQGHRRAWWELKAVVNRCTVKICGQKDADGEWTKIEAVTCPKGV